MSDKGPVDLKYPAVNKQNQGIKYIECAGVCQEQNFKVYIKLHNGWYSIVKKAGSNETEPAEENNSELPKVWLVQQLLWTKSLRFC